MTPIGRYPLNHSIQGIVMPMDLVMMPMASVLGASAVMNMLLVTMLAASPV